MNLKKATAGFAIQAAQGAAEAQPAFSGPVGGGKLAIVEVSQVEDELTSARDRLARRVPGERQLLR